MNKLIKDITDKDDNVAYKNFRLSLSETLESNIYYKDIDELRLLLDNPKSYIRIRAFGLICFLSRWDVDSKINDMIYDLLKLLFDEKPTVVRQCLSYIKELIVYKEELKDIIKKEILKIDINIYKDSMKPLIEKDKNEVLYLL